MKVIGYLRISSDKQDLSKQRHLLLEYAQKNQILISEFIEVEASSSKNAKERKIELLLDEVSDGDLVLVAELSRLGRNMLEVLTVVNELGSKGIKLIFVRQPELSTTGPHGKLLLAIYSYFAELEREFISIRTKQGLKAAKDKGIVLGRPKKSRNKRTLRLDKHKSEIAELLTTGVPIKSIQKIINAKLDQPISYTALRYYINNQPVLGDIKMSILSPPGYLTLAMDDYKCEELDTAGWTLVYVGNLDCIKFEKYVDQVKASTGLTEFHGRSYRSSNRKSYSKFLKAFRDLLSHSEVDGKLIVEYQSISQYKKNNEFAKGIALKTMSNLGLKCTSDDFDNSVGELAHPVFWLVNKIARNYELFSGIEKLTILIDQSSKSLPTEDFNKIGLLSGLIQTREEVLKRLFDAAWKNYEKSSFKVPNVEFEIVNSAKYPILQVADVAANFGMNALKKKIIPAEKISKKATQKAELYYKYLDDERKLDGFNPDVYEVDSGIKWANSKQCINFTVGLE